MTNDHVVRGAKNFEITLTTGGTPRTARLVGSDEASDLAVLKVIDPAGLVPTDFGDSSELSIGEFVLAMGNPLGLSGSVTDGIVSGLDRSVSFPAEPGAAAGSTISGLIQTSAPIQEGNSGGALIDLAGEVVGILVANVVNTETGATVPGIGFAIPSNTATRVVSQLIKNGKVTDAERATLGVAVQTVVSRRGRPAGVGVLRAAEGTGAPQAAIKPGSVIVSVDGTPTLTAQALAKVLAARKPGHRAKVKLRRPDGSPATMTVTLGKLPAD
ncbi:S1C family serine protease [Streptosporangium sp. NPDC003464]